VATLRIQKASGGEEMTIQDAALPFFLNQGYVVIGVLEGEGFFPSYLTKQQNDFRYVKISDLTDPTTPAAVALGQVYASTLSSLESQVEAIQQALGLLPSQIGDPTTTLGAAIRNAINAGGGKVNAAGPLPARIYTPSEGLPPANATEELLLWPDISDGDLVWRVYLDGEWVPDPGIVQPTTTTLTATASATANGTGQATLSWTFTPGTDNLTVTGIRISRSGTDTSGNAFTPVVLPAASGSRVFTGLTIGTAYTLTAQMMNGSSTVGSAVTRTVTATGTNPGGGGGTTATVVQVTATPGDQSVTLAYKVIPGTDNLTVTGVRVSRNGTDINGTVGWTEDVTALPDGSFTFLLMPNGSPVTVTAQMLNGTTPVGNPVSKTVTPVAPTGGGGGGGGPTNPPPVTGTGKFAALQLPARGYFSGASGSGVFYNSTAFGNWRGEAVDALAIWNDVGNGAVWNVDMMGPNTGPAANFKGLLDLSPGGPADYFAAANGSMDAALRDGLTRLRNNRVIGGVRYPTVVRPFHELNGNWYNWSVTPGNLAAFKATARRWRDIANQVFPEAIWALCFNGDPVNGIPAADHYEAGVWDCIGVDIYNNWPCIGTRKDGSFLSWEQGSTMGTVTNPRGIQRWREFAQSVNLPLYIPEYANNGAGFGDASNATNDPYWWNNITAYIKAHRGSGPGKIFAEIWFNIAPGEYGDCFWIWDNGNINPQHPAVAQAYANTFPIVG